MEELNEGVAPSFLMDEWERAGGRREGGWRQERKKSKLSLGRRPPDGERFVSECFVISQSVLSFVTSLLSTSSEADVFCFFQIVLLVHCSQKSRKLVLIRIFFFLYFLPISVTSVHYMWEFHLTNLVCFSCALSWYPPTAVSNHRQPDCNAASSLHISCTKIISDLKRAFTNACCVMSAVLGAEDVPAPSAAASRSDLGCGCQVSHLSKRIL